MMSRLTGGIGGRGPGETKLEIDRRRARERIHLPRAARSRRRSQPIARRTPRAAHAQRAADRRDRRLHERRQVDAAQHAHRGDVLAEDKLFATLDPTRRRLRFPREREVIITDTVGFIRDLPKDLVAAFRATLEELDDADLLLHVVDASDPRFEEQIEAVDAILHGLHLDSVSKLVVFNKIDRLSDGAEALTSLCRRHRAVAVSALSRQGLDHLVEAADHMLGELRPNGEAIHEFVAH